MSMEKLFEAIDSEVLDDDMKKSLQESFDAAVEAKSTEMIAERVEKEVQAKVLEEKESLETEYSEKYSTKLDEYKAETTDRISEYMELVVEEYLKENEVKIDESIKTAQVDALLEGFDTMLVTGGVSLKNITDKTDDTVQQSEIAELTERVNTLVESNTSLKKHNKTLLKMGLINEVSEDMTMVEKDKFEKLSEMIELDLSNTSEYMNKLLTLAESVTGEKVKDDVLDESKKEDELNESLKPKKVEVPSWAL